MSETTRFDYRKIPNEEHTAYTIEILNEDREVILTVHEVRAIHVQAVLKDDIAFTLVEEGNKLLINVPSANQHVARMILLEELLSLSDLLESTKHMKGLDEMGSDLMSGLFA